MNTEQKIQSLVKGKSKKNEISKFRRYLMQAFYLLVFIGLGLQAWREIINPNELIKPMDGIVWSFYAAFALLMGIGIRYPLKMLPLIFLQLIYKSIWLLGVYLPLKSAGQLDANANGFLKIMLTGVVLDIVVIPWFYVFENYVNRFFKFNRSNTADRKT